MNTYESYDLLAAILGLIITGALYGIFPVFFIFLRKSGITVKKLKIIFIVEGIGVHILSTLLAGAPETAGRIAPILIWTSLYIAIAKKALRKKGLLIEGNCTVQKEHDAQTDASSASSGECSKEEMVPTAPVSCISCGAELTQGDAFCNRCGAPQSGKEAPLPIRFCRKCGRQLKPDSIFCSFCGEKLVVEASMPCIQCKCQIPEDSLFCQYCGNTVVPAKNEKEISAVQIEQLEKNASSDDIPAEKKKNTQKKGLKRALYIIIPLAIILLTYFITNFTMGKNAEREGNYILAKKCFDNLLLSNTLAPEYIKYINAGVWMNNGDMYQAYLGFAGSDYDIPQGAWDELYSEMYAEGVQNYNKRAYSTAKWFFEKTPHYSRSDDYLFLIRCRNDTPPYNAVDGLKNLFLFADAKDLFVYSMPIAAPFLEGEWNGDSHYLKVAYENGSYSFYWNLPRTKSGNGNVYISEGTLFLGENRSTADSQFEITVKGMNTIAVFCYANNTEYTLYRSE